MDLNSINLITFSDTQVTVKNLFFCIQFESETDPDSINLIIFTFVQPTSGVNIELCTEFDLKSHLKVNFKYVFN